MKNFSIEVLKDEVFTMREDDNPFTANNKKIELEHKYGGEIRFIKTIVHTPYVIRDGD